MSAAQRMICVAAMLGCLAHVREARACTSDPLSAISGFTVLPADGSDAAPANTKIWVTSMRGYQALPASAFTVERAGAPLLVQVAEVRVSGEQIESLYVLEPMVTLLPGDTLDVFVTDDNAARERISQFRIGGPADTLAPALPALASIDLTGAAYGGYSCGSSSIVEIDVGPTSELLFMVDGADDGAGLPTGALAVGTDGHATAFDLAAGEQIVRYVTVDVAGNTSERSAPLTVTIPAQVSGCSASNGAGGWTLVLVGAVVASVRRRRRETPTRSF